MIKQKHLPLNWEVLSKWNILKITEIAKLINCKYYGDSDKEISHIASIENPHNDALVLVTKQKLINHNIFNSGCILTSEDLSHHFKSNKIISSNPKVDFAKITHFFASKKQDRFLEKKIDKSEFTIYFGNNVKFGRNFNYGLNVFIDSNVQIGDNVTLGNNVVIYSNVIIGNNVTIDSGSIIGSEGFGNVIDENAKWLHICHLGSVVIENNVSIGCNCCIDRGTIDNTIIKSGVIIDNLVHIAHNVVIGEDTALAAKTGIAGSCKIGKRNLIGGMVGIVDHITTADDVVISATSTVNSDINEPGTYTGIIPITKHASWKRIALWITKLDKIARLLNLKKI